MTPDGDASEVSACEEPKRSRLTPGLNGEVGRRLVHTSGVGIPLTYYVCTIGLGIDAAIAWRVIQALAVVGVVLATVLEYGRLRAGLDWRIFDRLTRGYEADKIAGYALYLVGIAVVALGFPLLAWLAGGEFPPPVALTGLFLLSLGDPLSGSLAADTEGLKGPRAVVPAFLFGTAVGYFVGLPLPAAVAAAVGLVVSDIRLWSIGGYVVDDNLTIPVVSGALAWLVMLLL